MSDQAGALATNNQMDAIRQGYNASQGPAADYTSQFLSNPNPTFAGGGQGYSGQPTNPNGAGYSGQSSPISGIKNLGPQQLLAVGMLGQQVLQQRQQQQAMQQAGILHAGGGMMGGMGGQSGSIAPQSNFTPVLTRQSRIF